MSLIADIHNDMEKGAVRLITEYRARLLCDAVRLCESTSDAEDLVSRTLVKVIGNIDTLKEDGSLYNWMKSIMVNLHRNDLAHPVARGTVPVNHETLVECAGADWGTDEEILRNSDGEAVRAALRNLDPEDREILILRYYEDLSLKEIASFLNKPVGTIGRRIHVALKLLAGKLGAKMNKTRKSLAVVLVAFLSLVSVAAVATLPAFEPLRETVASWFGSDAAPEEGIRGGGVSPAQTEDGFAPDDGELGRVGVTPPTESEPTITISNEQEAQPQQTQKEESQNMKLGKTVTAAAIVATSIVIKATEAEGLTLQVDKIQQRYPWNGLVDIDYTISYEGECPFGVDDNLEVLFADKSITPVVTNRASCFLQAPLPLTAGTHRITWDANADGVTNQTDKGLFLVRIAHYVPAYMVIDVSGGSATNIFPVSFFNGEPAGGFNVDEYKGNKIVLRRIRPGAFMAGSPSSPAEANRSKTNEDWHRVAFSKPFYIGIFEITQKQYSNVMAATPSQYGGNYRPVEKVSYKLIRGMPDESTHQYDWPWTNEVETTSFMGRLRAKCRSRNPNSGIYDVPVGDFDLPTDFQWEYACRAGTIGAFNTTNTYANSTDGQTEALSALGLFKGDQGNRRDNRLATDGHTEVGSYLPNAWGLYDMHGNVIEWCRDRFQGNAGALGQYVDPAGPDTGAGRVYRGGGWNSAVGNCRSAFRLYYGNASNTSGDTGFRLSLTLP